MAENSKIEWTTHTHNPWEGCAKVSPGCKNCYADAQQGRSPLALTTLLFQNNGTRENDRADRLTMPVSAPGPTVTTNGGNLYLATLLDYYYGNGYSTHAGEPTGCIVTKDRLNLVSLVAGFTFNHQFTNAPLGFDDPARTVVASRRHTYVVQLVPGPPAHLLDQPDDSDEMRQLKALCRANGIYDILMRLLKVSELKLIMGFPAWYILRGSATKQKKQLGNAVVPAVAEAIARAMAPALLQAKGRKLAPLKVRPVVQWEQFDLFNQPQEAVANV